MKPEIIGMNIFGFKKIWVSRKVGHRPRTPERCILSEFENLIVFLTHFQNFLRRPSCCRPPAGVPPKPAPLTPPKIFQVL